MTPKETLLKKTRHDLLDIIGNPTHATAGALLGAVRRYLRAVGPAAEPLTDEVLPFLPASLSELERALPHRRRADITRTVNRMAYGHRAVLTTEYQQHRGFVYSKKSP